MSNNSSSIASKTTNENSSSGNGSTSLYESITEAPESQPHIINGSPQLYPGVSDIFYGSPDFYNLNPKTPYGSIAVNNLRKGISLVSNSGIVMWSAFVADHPGWKTYRVNPYAFSVESVAYAADQNAVIVLVRTGTTLRTNFALVAYDATTGVPLDGIVSKIYETGDYNNNYSYHLSIAYNSYSKNIYCYSTTKVANYDSVISVYSFDRSSSTPFYSMGTAGRDLWESGTAPNQPGRNDLLISIAIDQENGWVYGLFQSYDSSLAGARNSLYVIPMSSNFATIRGARGYYLPIPESYDTNYVIIDDPIYKPDRIKDLRPIINSPSYIVHKGSYDYWYGLYITNHYSSPQKLYDFVVEINPSRGTSTPPTINRAVSNILLTDIYPGTQLAIDANQDAMAYAVVDSRGMLSNKIIKYKEGFAYDTFNSSSTSKWEGPINTTLIQDTTTNPDGSVAKGGTFRLVNSTFEHFENVTGRDFSTHSIFNLSTCIPLNYNAYILGYSGPDAGPNKYASLIDENMLKTTALGELDSNPYHQKPIEREAFWRVFKPASSDIYVDYKNFSATHLVADDTKGTLNFDITIPYQVGGTYYKNVIQGVYINNFPQIIGETAIKLSQVDANRFNNVKSISGYDPADPSTAPNMLFAMARNRSPVQYSLDQFKEMIASVMINKPTSFNPRDNLLITNDNITCNYKAGTVTVRNIKVNKWYSAAHELRDDEKLIKDTLVFKGFTEGELTGLNTTFPYVAPRSMTIEDFYKPAGSPPSWNFSTVKSYIADRLVNLPFSFNFVNDIVFDDNDTNVIINNEEGTLTIKKFNLMKWFDKDGKLHIDEPSADFSLTITGFIRITSATQVRNEYVTFLPHLLPTDISVDEVKKIINSIAINAPKDLKDSEITFASDTDYVTDNIKGTITVTPTFARAFNDKGMLENNVKLNTVVLKGYRAVNPTKLPDDWNFGNYLYLASALVNEKDYPNLKKMIAYHIQDLPQNLELHPNFNYMEDIILEKVTSSNLDGTIDLDLKLNKYYNDKGLYCNSGFTPQHITISGFKTIFGETSFERSYQIGMTDILPQTVEKTFLSELLKNVGRNIPPDFNPDTDVTFDNLEILPLEGKISITPILSNYYDSLGNQKTVPKIFPPIDILGFKKTAPTSFDPQRWVFGTSDEIAQEVANDYDRLKTLLMMKIINSPVGFSEDDFDIIKTFYSNRQGSVTVTLKLKKYYDDLGFLKEDNKSPIFSLTIYGFYIATSKTDISPNIDVHNPWKTGQELSIDELKELLIQNFKNLPPSFTPENILLTSKDIEYSNKEGLLIISNLKINKYFDQNIVLQNNEKIFSNIVLRGFKKTQTTIIPIDNWHLGDFNILPTEYIKDDNELKTLIASRIINTPLDFDPATNIVLKDIQAENSLGSIKVSVSLNYYYDSNGLLKTDLSAPVDIIISGFYIVLGPTNFITEINSHQPNVPPTNISKTDIQNILFNAISNPPPGLLPTDIIIQDSDIQYSNNTGNIKVIPSLGQWINKDLLLQTTERQFDEVTITGFKLINATTIDNFWNVGNDQLTPEEQLLVSNSETLIKQLIYNNVLNKPLDFTLNDINIVSATPINTKGAIRVTFKLNKFYDDKGILQTTGFPEKTIEILGYHSVQLTQIPDSGWLGNPNYLASDFLNPSMFDTLKEMIYRRILNLPPNFNYKENIVFTKNSSGDFNIVPNNSAGTLSVGIKIKHAYGSNDNGKIDVEGKSSNLNATIRFTGFYTQLGTNIHTSVQLSQCRDLIPQLVANDETLLKDIIFKNRPGIFDNLPPKFSVHDIVSANVREVNNKNGTLKVLLKIKNYYEKENGNIVNDEKKLLEQTILLNGFSASNATIFMNEKPIYLQSLSKELSSQFNASPSRWTQKWKTIIEQNMQSFVTNLPTIFDINADINKVTVSNINDAEGSCRITVNIKNYFLNDDQCTLQMKPTDINFVVLGFKKSYASSINSEITLKNINIDGTNQLAQNYLASYVFGNSSILNNIIVDNKNMIFNNLPENFNPSKNVTIKPVSYNNKNGSIVLNVSITNYYNEIGSLEQVTPLTKKVTIDGFKQIVATTYREEVKLDSISNILATSITNDELVECIYDNRELIFKNTLPEMTLAQFKSFFVIDKLDRNNRESMIVVTAKLGAYFDKDGNAIGDNKKPIDINLTILGFKQNKNNTIIREKTVLNDYKNVLASQNLNTDFIKNIVIAYKDIILINAPATLMSSEFDVSNWTANNKEGTMNFDLSLKKYYNDNGVLVDATNPSSGLKPLETNITVGGFERLVPTTIGTLELGNSRNIVSNIGSSSLAPSYYRDLPIDVAEQQLKDILINRIAGGEVNNILNDKLFISDFKFDPSSANDETNSLVVSFTLSNFITLDGFVSNPEQFTLTMNGFGAYKEATLSKDTLYYIMIVAIVYLSILSVAIIAYISYTAIKWKKGKK